MQRQRVELCQRTPHQPYHAAVGLDLAEARERIAGSRAEARRLARRALVAVRRELESGGWTLAGLGVLTASGRPLPALASVLASHPLIHSAEGELFRRALLQAGRSAGIAVTALPERELERRAASHLGRPAEELTTWPGRRADAPAMRHRPPGASAPGVPALSSPTARPSSSGS